MNKLHHHLARGDAFQHRFADRPFAHLGQEVLDHRQGDIGLEQGHAHLAQGHIDIGLAQRAAARQPAEYLAKSFRQPIEHRFP